ncbi:YraN family protein [Pseudokineococcus sp. 1T1Z-3]|uniref:YraN family protein n=1 Tax=Pseudokineococcus sp. 1T1Z-3 TaxID=3132745 RepID=UPI0030AB4EC8
MRVTDAVGRYGEQVAVTHLEAAGMTVVARNWRCAAPVRGELDVVVRDGDALVAVEVKTRRCGPTGTPAAGHPFEAVTPVKAARVRRLLVAFADATGERAGSLRVDAVAVLRPTRGPALVEHLRGVA